MTRHRVLLLVTMTREQASAADDLRAWELVDVARRRLNASGRRFSSDRVLELVRGCTARTRGPGKPAWR